MHYSKKSMRLRIKRCSDVRGSWPGMMALHRWTCVSVHLWMANIQIIVGHPNKSEIKLQPQIKALLGRLARLSWGRRNMISSMEGRQGRVYLEYVKGLTNKFAR